MNVWVSTHAADRFAERVRPGLDRKAATLELARLCREFGRRVEWPPWLHGAAQDGMVCIEISDGIIALAEGSARLRVVTVMTRGGHGEEHQHRGSFRRQKRRARRVGGPSHLDKASRPERRRGLMPDVDEAA